MSVIYITRKTKIQICTNWLYAAFVDFIYLEERARLIIGKAKQFKERLIIQNCSSQTKILSLYLGLEFLCNSVCIYVNMSVCHKVRVFWFSDPLSIILIIVFIEINLWKKMKLAWLGAVFIGILHSSIFCCKMAQSRGTE